MDEMRPFVSVIMPAYNAEAFLEAADITPTFVELPAPVPIETTASITPKVVAILKGTNHLTLEITEQASPSFLNALLGAMNHAQ